MKSKRNIFILTVLSLLLFAIAFQLFKGRVGITAKKPVTVCGKPNK